MFTGQQPLWGNKRMQQIYSQEERNGLHFLLLFVIKIPRRSLITGWGMIDREGQTATQASGRTARGSEVPLRVNV